MTCQHGNEADNCPKCAAAAFVARQQELGKKYLRKDKNELKKEFGSLATALYRNFPNADDMNALLSVVLVRMDTMKFTPRRKDS